MHRLKTVSPLISASAFWFPDRIKTPGWVEHIPFAFWIVETQRPRIFVELGTHYGTSYNAFCQAVSRLKLETKCFAIDTWKGDEHAGHYGEDVFHDFAWYQRSCYSQFSTLVRSTFDEAVVRFEDGSIDLLHIDGLHTYEAVKHDFETWLPKLSLRAIVLFHDTNVREGGFGVFRLWSELSHKYPSFEFFHGHGLGVLGVGSELPKPIKQLFAAGKDPGTGAQVREMYSRLGSSLQGTRGNPSLQEQLNEARQQLSKVSAQNDQLRLLAESARAWQRRSWFKRAFHRWRAPDGKREKVGFWRRLERSIRKRRKSLLKEPSGIDQNYGKWVEQFDTLSQADLRRMEQDLAQLQHTPLISVIMPTYNTNEAVLCAAIESVRNQVYQHWELCIADDASSQPHVRNILNRYRDLDKRIKIKFRDSNGHISVASNSAIALAEGEFLAFLDHDDELRPHALYMVARALNEFPQSDVIYSDEDKIDMDGSRFSPYFKPDWNPDLLRAQNYLCHLAVYRTSLVKKVGNLREGFEGSQDWDLALRATENLPFECIRHIPFILYHWRTMPGSTAHDLRNKNYALEAGRRAVEEHLVRTKQPAMAEVTPERCVRVRRQIPSPEPSVDLIIPTRNRLDLLRCAVTSICEKTAYLNFQIVIVDNNSDDPATLDFLATIKQDPRVRVLQYPGAFNFSKINNYAVNNSRADVVGLVNNDIEVINSDWLKEMVSQAVRQEIGAVGAKLYYPDNTIQHAGVFVGIGGGAGHVFKHLSRDAGGMANRAKLVQNLTAVTAACLLIRRNVYLEVGGLEENNLTIAYNDVDFCLRVRKAGYWNLFTPYAEFYHHESASRGYDNTREKQLRVASEIKYMKTTWGEWFLYDPAYNPNLTGDHEDSRLACPPRVACPWKMGNEDLEPTVGLEPTTF